MKMWNNNLLAKIGNTMGIFIGFDNETAKIKEANKVRMFVSLDDGKLIPEIIVIKDGEEEFEVSVRFKQWVDNLEEKSFTTKLAHGGGQSEQQPDIVQGIQNGVDTTDHIMVDGIDGERLEEGRKSQHTFCMEGDEQLMLMDRESFGLTEKMEVSKDFQKLCALGQDSRFSPSPFDNTLYQLDLVPETQPSSLNRGGRLKNNGQNSSNNQHQQFEAQEEQGRDLVIYGVGEQEEEEEEAEEGEFQEHVDQHSSQSQMIMNNNGEECIRREVRQVIEEGRNLGFNFNLQGSELEREMRNILAGIDRRFQVNRQPRFRKEGIGR